MTGEGFVPTTDEIREAYQMTGDGLDFKSAAARRGREFDAWVEAQRDQSVDHEIALEVLAERERQDEKWGAPHDQPDGTGPAAMPLYDVEAFLDDHTSAERLAAIFTHRTDTRAAAGEVTLADILLEEVFEALAESEREPLRAELVQVAAVCVKWVRILDEREGITR